MTSAPGSPDGAAPAASPGTEAKNDNEGRFRAPHRRTGGGQRVREKVVVTAYLAGSWVLGHLPFGPTVRVGGWIAAAVYALWPEKRRYVRANAARILGLPPDDRRVDALGRAVFRNQVRWVIEGMHLVRMTNPEHVALFTGDGPDRLHEAWQASSGVILAGLHIGNGEVAAAALAGRGWPVHYLADDTSYEELFERFVAQRRAWGIEVIRWRNLRDVYRVLRNREILGLLVDWGYRADGQPVRFLDGWTTLPSGPAVLAARTGATIVPFWTIRRPDGTFVGEIGDPIRVASAESAEIARATQAIADALATAVREAPEQWCVFKPIWPDDPAEEALLAERALRDLAGGPGNRAAGSSGRAAAHGAAG
jgi:lauroyl/myristoyl acyltransferase